MGERLGVTEWGRRMVGLFLDGAMGNFFLFSSLLFLFFSFLIIYFTGEKDEKETQRQEYAELKAQFVAAAGDYVCPTTNTITKSKTTSINSSSEKEGNDGKEEEEREISTYFSLCLRKNEVFFLVFSNRIIFLRNPTIFENNNKHHNHNRTRFVNK